MTASNDAMKTTWKEIMTKEQAEHHGGPVDELGSREARGKWRGVCIYASDLPIFLPWCVVDGGS